MHKIKKIIHKIFRMSGRDFLPYTHDNFYSLRRSKIIKNEGINLVFDIGAHSGAYCRELRENGYKGRVISFEPLSAAYRILEGSALKDSLWDCYNVAIGDAEEDSVINISGRPTSSSILPITDKHIGSCPSSATVRTEAIKVITLDSLQADCIKPDDKVLMKVDVQGYEKHVLRGAEATLKHVALIEVELSLSEMYKGGALIGDMLSTLDGLGFSLIAISQVFSDPVSGHLLQVDGIFIKRR